MKVKFKQAFVNLVLAAMIAVPFTVTYNSVTADDFNVDDYTVIRYGIDKGDTLWQIGLNYCDSEDDVREWIHEVLLLNNMDNAGQLRANTVIKIYKSKK